MGYTADGKYTIYHDKDRGLQALRYGEKWRDLCGDGWGNRLCNPL